MSFKIKTFEGACKVLSIDAKSLPLVSKLPKVHRDAIIAHFKLVIICQALNEGWKPNWRDTNQCKYYPWFKVTTTETNTSGVGLSFCGYAYWYSGTSVGSRLCYKSSELAEYAGKQFKKLYQQYFLLK